MLDGITNPLLVLNQDNEVVYANNYFRSTFLKSHNLDFKTTNQFNHDWLRINVDKELVIMNRKSSFKLFSLQIACFDDLELSEGNFIKIYNFNISYNIHTFKNDELKSISTESKINFYKQKVKLNMNYNHFGKKLSKESNFFNVAFNKIRLIKNNLSNLTSNTFSKLFDINDLNKHEYLPIIIREKS